MLACLAEVHFHLPLVPHAMLKQAANCHENTCHYRIPTGGIDLLAVNDICEYAVPLGGKALALESVDRYGSGTVADLPRNMQLSKIHAKEAMADVQTGVCLMAACCSGLMHMG